MACYRSLKNLPWIGLINLAFCMQSLEEGAIASQDRIDEALEAPSDKHAIIDRLNASAVLAAWLSHGRLPD